ncbi:MAG: type III pantothenate kinase [Solirubrobacterales bacterium]
MLLALDVGNTQTHIGVFEGSRLAEHWRFATDRAATGDEVAVVVRGLLGLSGIDFEDIDATIVSSVVPRLGPEYLQMAERHLGGEVQIVAPGLRTGMPIRMDNPHEVGADRLVNAVAAYDRFKGPCAVVDFGTAITFDVVSAGGEYLGGVIAPGIEISLEALSERAAKLPRIDLAAPASVVGKTTQASIQSGVMYGFAGAIDAIARRVSEEVGLDMRFIATGGLAATVVPHCAAIDEVDDLLTLTGLQLLHARNA